MRPDAAGPRILVASWLRWATSARLAAALIKLDVDVQIICPGFHPLLTVQGVRGRNVFRGSRPLASLRRAIVNADPDLVVSCDDETTAHLHRLLDRCAARATPEDIRIANLIERSFGPSDVFTCCQSRAGLLEVAAQAGVSTPASAPVASWRTLSDWIDRNGLPAYLKVDGTHGGNGIAEVRTRAEAPKVLARLSAPPGVFAALKYLIKQQDFGRIGNLLRRRGGVVSVQSAIKGHPANCIAVCQAGEVTAYIGAEVHATANATGFGTLIHITDNRDMEDAARAIARRLGLSGIFGLDFMIEAETNRAQLIEMNPRATPLAHFRFGPGRDPAAALRALAERRSFHQTPPGESGVAPPKGLIAVFPHMLSRGVPDVDGQPVMVDAPWDMPDLIRLSMPLPHDPLRFACEILSRFFL
jgi:hypothetical protein